MVQLMGVCGYLLLNGNKLALVNSCLWNFLRQKIGIEIQADLNKLIPTPK
jgi:hypothetical protein